MLGLIVRFIVSAIVLMLVAFAAGLCANGFTVALIAAVVIALLDLLSKVF